MNKKTLFVILASLALTGCTTTPSSQPSASTQESTQPSTEISTEPSVEPSTEPEFEEENFTEAEDFNATGVSAKGIFENLGYDVVALVTGKQYLGTITQENASSEVINVSYSVPGIVEIVGGMKSGLTVNAIKAGGTVVTFRDSNNYMLYRTAINVRDGYEAEDVIDYVVEEVSYFYPIQVGYDTYRITFTTATNGLFYAKEGDYDYGTESFTFEIDPELKSNGYFEYYSLAVVMDDSYASLALTEICLAKNGSSLIPFDNSGITVNLFKAIF
ncbi:MAG: hypothetical protein WCR67_06490 [Bacilli bacterium]